MDAASLRSLLECPVCYLIPRTHILICNRGHSLCSECFRKLKQPKTCPQGRCPYSDPTPRNLIAEKIALGAQLGLNCKNASDGCTYESLTASSIVQHEQLCKLNYIPCPEGWDGNCNARLTYDDLLRHLKCYHENVVFHDDLEVRHSCVQKWLVKSRVHLRKDSCLWNGVVFKVGESRIPTLLRFVKKNGFWCTWVSALCDDAIATSMTYDIKFGMQLELVFRGKVNPVGATVEEVISEGSCLMLPEEVVLAKYISEGNISAASRSCGFDAQITVKYSVNLARRGPRRKASLSSR